MMMSRCFVLHLLFDDARCSRVGAARLSPLGALVEFLNTVKGPWTDYQLPAETMPCCRHNSRNWHVVFDTLVIGAQQVELQGLEPILHAIAKLATKLFEISIEKCLICRGLSSSG